MWSVKIISIGFLLISFGLSAQIRGNANRLTGTWEYKQGSGFEIWNSKDGQLEASGYRLNKLGDTTKVETATLRYVNKRLIYKLTTLNISGDSIQHVTYSFLGGKRKMKFENIDSDTPYTIQYKLGIFRRNHLKIIIRITEETKPVKLHLKKVKE